MIIGQGCHTSLKLRVGRGDPGAVFLCNSIASEIRCMYSVTMSTDRAMLSIIPEQQQARFDELMVTLQNAWQQSPNASKQLLEVASMILPGVPVLSEPLIRERALENAQIQHRTRAQTRLIGDMSGHTDFSIEFGTDESRFISLQRQAGTQTIELSFAFIGHEFQGATMVVNDTGDTKTAVTQRYGITRRGLLVENLGGETAAPGRPVDMDKLSQSLVNYDNYEEPLKISTLISDISLPG